MSGNFEKDKFKIISLEDYWIDKFKSEGNDLYNVGLARSGKLSTYRRSSYGRRDLHEKIIDLISHGFKGPEISRLTGIPKGSLTEVIREACNGKRLKEARVEIIGNTILDLISEDIFTISSLAQNFRGMSSNDVFNFLAYSEFELGPDILKGMIASAYIAYRFNFDHLTSVGLYEWSLRDVTAEGLAEYLGLDYFQRLSDFVNAEMGGFRNIKNRGIQKYTREFFSFLAKLIIGDRKDADKLLEKLHLDFYYSSDKEVSKAMLELFNMSFERAKLQYSRVIFRVK